MTQCPTGSLTCAVGIAAEPDLASLHAMATAVAEFATIPSPAEVSDIATLGNVLHVCAISGHR
ncbi:hypothetical protein Pth03_82370 [Planotetraspora thailandica]|uniref:Uncharacterized protein n=1 Tax=Planotetraspora thailandica TaxID=487172 RepID=A0A8J4DFM5_9ACTN|nr:hypothetical protein [Planotetraspora thailandica]GII59848.1 hypothetical protein Pth03_82370 [Planotetraspora thailandica]